MLKGSVDKIVKEKLNGIVVEPPAYVWDAINQHMVEAKQRRRVLIYWQSAAAVALVLLSVGIIFFMSDRSVQQEQMANVEKPMVVKEDQVEMVKQKEPVGDISTELKTALSTVSKSIGTDKPEEMIQQPTRVREFKSARIIEKSDVSVNQPVINRGNKIGEDVYFAKMDNLSALKIVVDVPDSKLRLPQKSISNSPKLYAYNDVMPVYKPKLKRYKFIVGGSASPTYNYRSVNEFQSPAVVRNAYDSPTSETGVVSVAGGVNVRMEGKSRWSFETGVLYSQVGQEVSQTATYSSISSESSFAYASLNNIKGASANRVNKFSSTMGSISYNNNTAMGVEQNLLKSGVYLEASANAISNQPESTTLKQLLDYIEVPLMVRYSVLNKKQVITLAGGFSTNFLVDNNVYLIENGEHVNAGETDGINGVTYSSTLGIGLELPLGKSFRFSLEPRFKYYLSPVNSQGYNSFRPYSFGIFGGVSFIINNH